MSLLSNDSICLWGLLAWYTGQGDGLYWLPAQHNFYLLQIQLMSHCYILNHSVPCVSPSRGRRWRRCPPATQQCVLCASHTVCPAFVSYLIMEGRAIMSSLTSARKLRPGCIFLSTAANTARPAPQYSPASFRYSKYPSSKRDPSKWHRTDFACRQNNASPALHGRTISFPPQIRGPAEATCWSLPRPTLNT